MLRYCVVPSFHAEVLNYVEQRSHEASSQMATALLTLDNKKLV